MKINFIGIGAIGLPMALQVQQAGHQVTGIDISEAVIKTAKASGLSVVSTLSEAPDADLVIVMVATPDQLASLVEQIAQPTPGQLWVIMSTVGPQSMRQQGEQLRHMG